LHKNCKIDSLKPLGTCLGTMSATLNISPLRISTMTITGHLGGTPDLKRLFDDCHFIPYWTIGEGIIKIECPDSKKGECTEDILHKSTKEKKRFFNQSSLVFRLRLSGEANSPVFKEINMKLFKNGGFQLTGVSSEEMARNALQRMIDLNKGRGIWDTPPYIKTFNIQMINSDYTIGKAIRRDRLYRTLVEQYGLWSSFDPITYQGVNTKFFWNKMRPANAPPGVCACPTPCEGEGSGYKIGECKKITIAPFRTGSVIITGAKHMEQLTDAYTFMNSVFHDHAEFVLRDEVEQPGKKKTAAPPTTAEGILKQKMRASPRNVVKSAVKA
jgi:TATA-box binding protein (TBP) (component of TFIID and TFIIIB)